MPVQVSMGICLTAVLVSHTAWVGHYWPEPARSTEGPGDMAEKRAPSVRARQLAAELRRMREAATMTGDEAAKRLGWSGSKISRIETGQTAVTLTDLQLMLDIYGV